MDRHDADANRMTRKQSGVLERNYSGVMRGLAGCSNQVTRSMARLVRASANRAVRSIPDNL